MDKISVMGEARTKRSVKAEMELPLSPSEVWRRVSDISGYPDFVRFMKQVSVDGGFEVGSHWSDISTVLYFPLKFRHKIAKIEEGRTVYYLIDLPRGGRILQKFEIIPRGKVTRARLTIEIDLNNQLADKFLGKFFEKRTQVMIGGTFEAMSSLAQNEKKGKVARNRQEKELFIKKWYLGPAVISISAFIILALVFAFKMPSEIKAAPGKIIAKVKVPELLVVSGANKLKDGVHKVNDKLEDIVLK